MGPRRLQVRKVAEGGRHSRQRLRLNLDDRFQLGFEQKLARVPFVSLSQQRSAFAVKASTTAGSNIPPERRRNASTAASLPPR